MTTYHIFIGYDDREHEAYLVAKNSLESRSTVSIKVHKLHHKDTRNKGLLTRPSSVVGSTGQYIDGIDGRPFSTQFTFSRFLIGELWKEIEDEDKSPLVMFCDCDFLFLDDIREMFKEVENQKLMNSGKSPVYCVQHDYSPENTIKMDNIDQSKYNMKLWAAMMVLDMEHKENEKLTPELVNKASGRDLMNFCWVSDLHSIGCIPEQWQFVPDHSEKNTNKASIIHWTEGGPYFANYRDVKFSDVWFNEFEKVLREKLAKGQEGLEELLDG